jgi:hypothetical protein
MCFACDMEAMWFAVMEARANAAAGEGAPQPGEPATLLAPGQQEEPASTLLPPPERGRVGEGVAGGTDEAAPMLGESEDPHPNPPPEEGGGGASAERASSEGAPDESTRQRPPSRPSRRFACEETSAE